MLATRASGQKYGGENSKWISLENLLFSLNSNQESYGRIKDAICLETERVVAIKEPNDTAEDSSNAAKQVMSLLVMLNHGNIVK